LGQLQNSFPGYFHLSKKHTAASLGPWGSLYRGCGGCQHPFWE